MYTHMKKYVKATLNIIRFIIHLLKVGRWPPQVSVGTFGTLRCFMVYLFPTLCMAFLGPPWG